MDFTDSESESDVRDLDRLHEQKMKKLEQKKKNWGKNRQEYYTSDTQYFEVDKDQDAIRAEEYEIKLIQQEQSKLMKQMDFGLDSLFGTTKPTTKAATTTPTGTITTATTTTKQNTKVNTKSGKSILSIEERVRQVLSTSPELLTLFSTYLKYSQELIDIIPLLTTNLTEIKEMIDIGPILSLIKLRQQLLLQFCSCILFYLYLKSMGKSTTEHPVMSKLLALQTLIDNQSEIFNNINNTLMNIQTSFIIPLEEYNTTMQKRTAKMAELSQRSGRNRYALDSDEMGEDETAAEYYKRMSSQINSQKAARAELHKGKGPKRAALGSNIIDRDQRRGIGIKIDQNVGLRRQKSKKQIKFGATRGKLRKKHETAITKHKSKVREYKGSQGNEYTGEATIKKGLIRSVRLG